MRVGAERTKACNTKGDKWLSGFEPFHHLCHSDGGVLALVFELEEKERGVIVKKSSRWSDCIHSTGAIGYHTKHPEHANRSRIL